MAAFGFGRPSAVTLDRAPTRIPTLSFTEPIRELILKTTELKPESKPHLLEGFHLRCTFAAKKEMKEDRNVVGLFPGSDPDKAKEVIIYSAHYDHVGVNDKGEIYNGSDDNASGTSALLEIAEAFGDGPRPARSIAFLWVSGEEKGLLGSQWFSDHVSLPQDFKIVADINLDMVSRNDAKSIGITPSDKHADYSTLIPVAMAAAKEEGLTTKFDADQFYFRTDSYHFARKGIPIVFFFCGVHDDYHRPTDDFTKADFEKAARVARSAYRLGWQVAQAKDVPKKIRGRGGYEMGETRERRVTRQRTAPLYGLAALSSLACPSFARAQDIKTRLPAFQAPASDSLESEMRTRLSLPDQLQPGDLARLARLNVLRSISMLGNVRTDVPVNVTGDRLEQEIATLWDTSESFYESASTSPLEGPDLARAQYLLVSAEAAYRRSRGVPWPRSPACVAPRVGDLHAISRLMGSISSVMGSLESNAADAAGGGPQRPLSTDSFRVQAQLVANFLVKLIAKAGDAGRGRRAATPL